MRLINCLMLTWRRGPGTVALLCEEDAGMDFVHLISLLYHPYLACILFDMPFLHLFNVFIF